MSALAFLLLTLQAMASPDGLRAQELPQPSAGLPSSAEINSVLNELAAITGFRVRRQLPFAMVTRVEVNRFLKRQMRRSVKPAEIRAEETTLKKFGFVAPDFDLKKTTIDLLTEQAAAYYDFHRKKLFISDWASRTMREAALIHELAHALADQNFPIQKFLAAAGDDSEESLARETVVEGQASWLMIEVAARRQGTSLGDPQTAGLYLKDVPGDDAGFP
ncbi:MAG: ImmA/IrrE family metallo-endopeptidase, partial [Terriglobia bacterium]